MDNNIADILAKNIHFDYLRQVESIFKQLETGIKKTPEAFIGNSEIADKFYEFMKDIDGFGFALENLGRYDEALMFYMSAGKYLEMSYHLVSKPDANHHIAICDLTVARVYLALNNYLGFAEWYHHFFDNSVAAINDKDSGYDEVFYLRKQTRELFEKAKKVDKKMFSNLLRFSLNAYTELAEAEKIDEGEYYSLRATALYLLIVFEIGVNEELLKEHVDALEKILSIYGKEKGLKIIYEQFDGLLHASFIPEKYKQKYRIMKELLFKKSEVHDNTIRVFISSVFRDFQDERDVLQNIVVPEMKSYCKVRYGLDFEIIDLRWGIELNNYLSEFETMYKVLSVCGEMIERAKPYFLLFVSNSYGTEVEKTLINQIYPNLASTKALSITEIEFLLRSYSEENIESIFLFEKDRETIKDPRVLSFVEEVKSLIPEANCGQYAAKSNKLAKLIIDQLKAHVDKDYDNNQVFNNSEYKLEQLASKMVGFSDFLEFTIEKLHEDNRRLFVINSPMGGGKSTFLAKVFSEAKKAGFHTFPFLVKDFDRDVAELEFMLFIKRSLEKILGIPSLENRETSVFSTLVEIKELIGRLEDGVRIVFFVDDYDLMIANGELLSWFSTAFYPLQFVVSVKESEALFRLIGTGALPIQLTTIKSEDFELFVSKKFEEHYKVVNPDINLRLLLKFTREKADINPLYLTALINHLVYINAEDYATIYRQIAREKLDFAQAIANHQRELIQKFPATLEAYAEDILKTYADKSYENAIVLAFLAFTYLTGISVEKINSLFEKTEAKFEISSFIDLKFDLGNLIDVEGIDFAKIRHFFVAQTIFKILPKDMIDAVGAFIIANDEDYPYSPVVRALIHFKEFETLTHVFKKSNSHLGGVIAREFLYHPEGGDYIYRYIEEVEINRDSLALLHELYVNNVKVTLKNYPRTFAFLDAILTRLESELVEHEEPQLIYDYYAMFSKEHIENIPTGKEVSGYRKHLEFIEKNLPKFSINNPFILDYFNTFIKNIRQTKIDYWPLLTKFSELTNEAIIETDITWIDAKFSYLVLTHLLGFRFGEEGLKPLDAFIDLFDTTYKGELIPSKLNMQMDLLFFIGDACIGEDRTEDAFKYYKLLYRALYHESLVYPNTSKLIKMRSTTTNNLAAHYITKYLYIFYDDPSTFERTDEAYKNEISYVEDLILETVFAAQTAFNANPNEETLLNNNVSNLNYSIFYATFMKNPNKAINNLSTSIANATNYFRNRLFDHQGVINALLYNQIFLDFYNIKKYDSLEVLAVYKREMAPYNPYRVNLDAEYILSFINTQLQVMRIEKSPTYLALEAAVLDFIAYLKGLPPL